MINIIKSKVKKKINFITMLIFIVISIIMLTLYLFERNTIVKTTNSELQNTNLAIVNMVKTATKSSVRSYLKAIADGNIAIINKIYQEFIQGKYTKKEAMDIISKIISSNKIGKTGYTYIVNSKGVMLVHPKNKLINEDLSQYAFIKEQMSNERGYLEYDWKNPDELFPRKKALYMEYFKEWDLIVSVSAYRDEFEGLINTNDFRDEVLSTKYEEKGYAYIITDKGIVVIHPNYKEGENWYEANDSKGNQFIKKICEQKNGTISYFWKNPNEIGEKEKLVTFKYIPELKWIVVSGSYKDEYLKPLKNIQIIIFVSSTILLLLYLIQSYLFTKVVIRPILELVKGVRQAIKREELQIINVNTDDEIGELSEEFILLNDSIKNYETNLEKMVEKRTNELSNAYEEIKKINYINEKKEQFLRTLLETIPNPIFYKDNNFVYVGCNSAFEKFTGQKREDLIGKSVFELFRKELADKYHEKDVELVNSRVLQTYESKVVCSTGEIKNVIFNKDVYYLDNEVMGIVGTIEDITEIKKMELMLKELTVKDALTGLYNRRGITDFSEALFEHSVRNQCNISVLMIDLDNFKLYNDTYGHPKGDVCLIEVAHSIQRSCNRPMDMVGRYGGEEFLVILIDTDAVGAVEVAERIEKNIRDLAIEHLGSLKEKIVTASIGVYSNIPKQTDDKFLYIQKADEKLYAAKANGKGRVES